jgi:D-3-phosphoglycerate dehydrogenase
MVTKEATMKIVILEPIGLEKSLLKEMLSPLEDEEIVIYDTISKDEDEMIQRTKEAEVIVIANTPLSKKVIESCPKLQLISVAFVGIDHIAIDICKEKSITICNAAQYCTHAVSELTLGLTLSVLRNIPQCDLKTRALQTKEGLVGHELFQKSFGIVGTGDIGSQVAKLALAFGCSVYAYSKTEKESLKALGVEYISLEALVRKVDILSIHVPLTDQTNNLINSNLLDRMKPSSILINTARGPIVDQKYLAYCLREGKIAGAGIDVFDMEPPLNESQQLINENKAVLTPHVAYATKESIRRRGQIVIDNIIGFIEGKPKNVML